MEATTMLRKDRQQYQTHLMFSVKQLFTSFFFLPIVILQWNF